MCVCYAMAAMDIAAIDEMHAMAVLDTMHVLNVLNVMYVMCIVMYSIYYIDVCSCHSNQCICFACSVCLYVTCVMYKMYVENVCIKSMFAMYVMYVKHD